MRTTDVEDIARHGRELWLADCATRTGGTTRRACWSTPAPGAYVATKSLFGSSALYAAPPRLDPDRVSVLTKVADVPLLPTGGAFSPRGDRFVLRSYRYALVWRVGGGDVAAALRRPPLRVTLPAQRQGEGVTVTRDGTRLVVSSEGARAAVYAVPLPGPSPAGGAPTHPGRETADREGPGGGRPARWLLGGVAAVTLGALAGASVAVAGRRRRGPAATRPRRRP